MTTAEELRKYADKALKEGGIMYFSDEYLDALASRAEAEQAETEKLRKLVIGFSHAQCFSSVDSEVCHGCAHSDSGGCKLDEEMRAEVGE